MHTNSKYLEHVFMINTDHRLIIPKLYNEGVLILV